VTTRTRKPARTRPLPTAEEEAAAYARGLERRGQVADAADDPLPAGVTHVVVIAADGSRRYKRKRYR